MSIIIWLLCPKAHYYVGKRLFYRYHVDWCLGLTLGGGHPDVFYAAGNYIVKYGQIVCQIYRHAVVCYVSLDLDAEGGDFLFANPQARQTFGPFGGDGQCFEQFDTDVFKLADIFANAQVQ
jgi:hypothetical protein